MVVAFPSAGAGAAASFESFATPLDAAAEARACFLAALSSRRRRLNSSDSIFFLVQNSVTYSGVTLSILMLPPRTGAMSGGRDMRSFIIRRASSDERDRLVKAEARLPSRLYASRLDTRAAVEPSWLVAVFVLDILGPADVPRGALPPVNGGEAVPFVTALPGNDFRAMLNNRNFAGSIFVDRTCVAVAVVVIADNEPPRTPLRYCVFKEVHRKHKYMVNKFACFITLERSSKNDKLSARPKLLPLSHRYRCCLF